MIELLFSSTCRHSIELHVVSNFLLNYVRLLVNLKYVLGFIQKKY